MTEWDPDRERYEPERDFQRDYVTPRLGYPDRSPGRRQSDYQRGVWSIGGSPRPQAGYADASPGEVAAVNHAGKGPRNYRRSDVSIYEEVCDRLERDPDVDASDVEVTVKDGEVTLSGTIADRRMRRLAEDVAAACHCVHDVHNRLRVVESTSHR